MRNWVGQSSLFPLQAADTHSDKHNGEEGSIGSCKDNSWNLEGRSATNIYLLDQGNQKKAVFLCFTLYFFILSAKLTISSSPRILWKMTTTILFGINFSSRALMHQHPRPQIKIPVRENLIMSACIPTNIHHTDISYTGFFQYQFGENCGQGEGLLVLPFCWRSLRLKLTWHSLCSRMTVPQKYVPQ